MGRKRRLPILPSPHFSPVFYYGGKGLQAFVATVPLARISHQGRDGGSRLLPTPHSCFHAHHRAGFWIHKGFSEGAE
jgi:hypothetical protein